MNKNNNKALFKMIKKSVMSLTIAVMMTLSTFITGCASSPGRDGKDGSIWYSGLNVSEYVNSGNNGDFFFDSDDQLLYQKINGLWVQISDVKQYTGKTQTVSIDSDGYWVINGNTTMFKCTGNVGNTPYIHLNTWWIDGYNTTISANGLEGKSAFDLYKEQNLSFNGTLNDWLEILRGEKGEQGEQGDPGATWLTGKTNPQNGDGKNGDFYINTTTFDIFKKVDDVWTCVGNIKGADGDSGYDRLYVSKNGTSDTPVFLDEKDVNIYDIKLASEYQKTTIYGTNRLDLKNANIGYSSYRNYHTIEKDIVNGGIILEATGDIPKPEDDPDKIFNVQVSYVYEAEFSGKLWLSCVAELLKFDDGEYGNVFDSGMRMYVQRQNGTGELESQYLCRGVGELSESVEVEAGDKVTIAFYIKISSDTKSKIKYNNIMLQYGNLTDYVPYVENQTNFYIDDETDEVVYSELPDLKNISTGYAIKSEGDFTVNYSYLEQKKTLKVVNFGDSITGLATNEVAYSAVINRTSNIEAYNVGFAGTTYEDHGNSKYNPFSFNRLVDAICSDSSEPFKEQEKQLINIISNKSKLEYITRLETLKSINFKEIDYVTIFYGYNDWNYGNILKSEDDASMENKQQTNLEDALKYSINKLKEKFPLLKIIVLTPYRCAPKVNDEVVDIDTYIKNGYKLEDFADYIKEIAGALDVEEIIDLYEMTDFVNTSNYGYYMYDGVHPNSQMNQILAQILIETINNLEKIK